MAGSARATSASATSAWVDNPPRSSAYFRSAPAPAEQAEPEQAEQHREVSITGALARLYGAHAAVPRGVDAPGRLALAGVRIAGLGGIALLGGGAAAEERDRVANAARTIGVLHALHTQPRLLVADE